MSTNTIKVDFVKAQAAAMHQKAKLPRTLMGGTEAMRKAEKMYLPQEPKESSTAYAARLSRTVLFNAFAKSVGALTGKLFKKDVTLSEKTPPQLVEWCEDIDLQGNNLTRFVRAVALDAMIVGLSHIVVDMPPLVVDEEGNPRTLTVGEEKSLNRRPYLCQYLLEDCLNWRVKDGKLVLVVLQEPDTEAIDEFQEKTVPQIRVLRPGSWETWRQDEKQKGWFLFESGKTTLDFIPIITVYTNKTGFMTATPLLQDLAYLNVAHWQSSSDQRHILHVARVPLLFGTGWGEDNPSELEIGPNSLTLQPAGATMAFVEHSGASVSAGAADIEALEARMSAMALEPLMPKTGNVTATATAIDTAEAQSVIQDIANGLKDSIENLLVMMGSWVGIPKEQCGEASVFADFSLNLGDQSALTALQAARTMGDISRDAYINELKRRDILVSDYDSAADKDLIDQEAAALAEMMAPPEPPMPASVGAKPVNNMGE